jgi:SAM-dependent methyltransferase
MTDEGGRGLYVRQHEIWPAWSESEGDAPSVAEFLEQWLGLDAGASVVDFGCGVGRELVCLARRGHRGLGIDASAELLRRAKRRAGREGVADRLGWIEGDFRTVEVPYDLADLAMFWDSTLNLFEWDSARASPPVEARPWPGPVNNASCHSARSRASGARSGASAGIALLARGLTTV